MIKKIKFLMISIVISLFQSCAADRQTENYEFKDSSPLTLTTNNHPHGYTKSTCFNCHLPQNIHQVDHLHDSSFPFAQSFVEQKGLASCSGCHGNNGVIQ